MKAEQFSLQRMLVAISAIAVGLAIFSYVPHYSPGGDDEWLACASAACIGCGIGTIFRKPIWGAAIGFGIVTALLFAISPPAMRE
jgi:uncharacterized membrane protein YccC